MTHIECIPKEKLNSFFELIIERAEQTYSAEQCNESGIKKEGVESRQEQAPSVA